MGPGTEWRRRRGAGAECAGWGYGLCSRQYRSIFVEIFLLGTGIFVYFGERGVSAVRGHPRSVILVNRKRVCDFLLVRTSNLGPILHRFGDLTGFMCY